MIELDWFLPTGGDSRDVLPDADGAHRRRPDHDYLAQVAQACDQLGFDAPAEPAGTYESTSQQWALFEAALDGFPIDIAVAEFEGNVAAVLLVSTTEERETLVTTVLEPVLDAFTPL